MWCTHMVHANPTGPTPSRTHIHTVKQRTHRSSRTVPRGTQNRSNNPISNAVWQEPKRKTNLRRGQFGFYGRKKFGAALVQWRPRRYVVAVDRGTNVVESVPNSTYNTCVNDCCLLPCVVGISPVYNVHVTTTSTHNTRVSKRYLFQYVMM